MRNPLQSIRIVWVLSCTLCADNFTIINDADYLQLMLDSYETACFGGCGCRLDLWVTISCVQRESNQLKRDELIVILTMF